MLSVRPRFKKKNSLPVSVNKGMENGEVSLDGDGDCHEDAGAEEDVVERVESVGWYLHNNVVPSDSKQAIIFLFCTKKIGSQITEEQWNMT